MHHVVVPIISCLCINHTVLKLWGVNLRERRWWNDSWWPNYEILTSFMWRMDWGLSRAFCLFTFLCFCVLNIMHHENVLCSWLAWIHHSWLKLSLAWLSLGGVSLFICCSEINFQPFISLEILYYYKMNFRFGFGKSRAQRISKEHTDFYWETLFCIYVNNCTEINVMQNILIVP